ncbi:CopD family protein [Pseudomonas typographi]|uniref:Copper resistance protein D n=1 Tax=Pseudomonas typographi TaxID=2715964 RepID=A0ABR7Z845_9PSED|nr:CopD family protein [Pseudomonas typographi]MBD1601714.1 copper resistance protein CopD [Pseudomonas typographi]
MRLLVLFRLIHFFCLMVLFGVAVFRPLLIEAKAVMALRRAMDPFLCLVALFALLSGIGWLLAGAAQMAGSWPAGVAPATLRKVLLATFFGNVWSVHLVLCLVQLVYWRIPGWRSHTPALALATLTLGTLAPVGHAAMFSGVAGGLLVLNQLLHLLATGAWLGALLLMLCTRFMKQGIVFEQVVFSFSRYGTALVVVILLTGVANVRAITGQFVPSGSAYAAVLATKAVLVVAMLALALYNRTQAARPVPHGLALSVGAEWLCGVAALAAVALLGTLAPVPWAAL